MTPTLHVPALQDSKATAKQDIFLQVPQIDRFAWHPFTIMQHKRQLDGTGLLTMQIKRYSDWTKELFMRSQVSAAASGWMTMALCVQPGQRCCISCLQGAQWPQPGQGWQHAACSSNLWALNHQLCTRRGCGKHHWPCLPCECKMLEPVIWLGAPWLI